jgi:hypothetical protein
MKIEEIVILGLTGAAAYLVWRMKSQKTAMVTQSITAPVARSPVSTAVVPVGSGPPTMPIWTPGDAPVVGPYIAESFPMAPRKECPYPYVKRALSNGSYMCDFIQGAAPAPKPGVGHWLDQTTYRLEMPPTRDIMPQFLMNPPDCPQSLFQKRQLGPNCADMKRIECKVKGGSVVMSEFESMGPNSYGAKYGYCVDCEPPKVPTEVEQALNARCSLLHLEPMPQVFGKDPGHRHGQYQIWKCVSVKGA